MLPVKNHLDGCYVAMQVLDGETKLFWKEIAPVGFIVHFLDSTLIHRTLSTNAFGSSRSHTGRDQLSPLRTSDGTG